MELEKEKTAQSFEDMYSHFENIAKSFKVNFIPLNTLEMVVSERKLKNVDGSIVKFEREYNKILDKFLETCTKQANINNLSKIHLRHIKQYIDIIVSNL